jgi:hypothetical protein
MPDSAIPTSLYNAYMLSSSSCIFYVTCIPSCKSQSALLGPSFRREHNIMFFLALMFPVLAELFSHNVVTLHFKWLLNCSRRYRLASLHSLSSENSMFACPDCCRTNAP